MSSIGNLIKSNREKRNLSQEYMADRLGITARAYQNYEYGSREPRLGTLKAIAEILGIPVGRLIDEHYIQNESNVADVSLSKISSKLDSIQSQLFAHIVRSSERFSGEDPQKLEREMDKIDRYAQRFLEANLKKGIYASNQDKV